MFLKTAGLNDQSHLEVLLCPPHWRGYWDRYVARFQQS